MTRLFPQVIKVQKEKMEKIKIYSIEFIENLNKYDILRSISNL